MLKRAYSNTRKRRSLTAALDHIQRVSGFSRVAISTRARGMGLTVDQRRPWTEEETKFLEENIGVLSRTAIARKLRRTHYSVKARASTLQLSLRVSEGYSCEDLRMALGVGSKQVRRWIQIGWLKVTSDRISERSVINFLRQHPEEYSLRRVDEAWFKGLLFPTFGQLTGSRSAMWQDAPEPRNILLPCFGSRIELTKNST